MGTAAHKPHPQGPQGQRHQTFKTASSRCRTDSHPAVSSSLISGKHSFPLTDKWGPHLLAGAGVAGREWPLSVRFWSPDPRTCCLERSGDSADGVKSKPWQGEHPGLSGRAPGSITSILNREGRAESTQKRTLCDMEAEVAVTGPHAKGGTPGPPEAGGLFVFAFYLQSSLLPGTKTRCLGLQQLPCDCEAGRMGGASSPTGWVGFPTP